MKWFYDIAPYKTYIPGEPGVSREVFSVPGRFLTVPGGFDPPRGKFSRSRDRLTLPGTIFLVPGTD